MIATETVLTSSLGNLVFGDALFVNPVVETLFRYIALKHSDSDDIRPIKGVLYNAYTEINLDVLCRPNDVEDIHLIETDNKGFSQVAIPVNWIELNSTQFPVNVFLSKVIKTRVFCNLKTEKTIIVVTKTPTDQWYSRFCSILFRLLPWIYVDGKVPDDEIEVFRLFTQEKFDSNKFKEIIDETATRCNLREIALRKTLCGWENSIRGSLLNEAEECVTNHLEAVRNAELRLGECLDKLSVAQNHLKALSLLPLDNSNSVYQFFATHKQLHVISKKHGGSASTIKFSILDTIEFYDYDVFSAVYNNPSSPLGKAPKDIRDIFWGLFGINKGVMRVEALFNLNNLSSLVPVCCDVSGECNDTHLPHPHLYHHGCLGGNKNYILKYMEDGDWDLAIEQAIAAVKNINFGDAVVLNEFIGDVKNRMTDCKFIIADNGEEMTLMEFLYYIIQNEEEEKKNG